MDKLIEFALLKWPNLMEYLVLILMIIIIIGLPFAAFWWFKKFINKDWSAVVF